MRAPLTWAHDLGLVQGLAVSGIAAGIAALVAFGVMTGLPAVAGLAGAGAGVAALLGGGLGPRATGPWVGTASCVRRGRSTGCWRR